MGIFDGILLCSDWDGTLFDSKEVPEGSINAIEYFKSEGGLFSICSGRAPGYIEEMSRFVKPNTFSICYGGSLVHNLLTKETIIDGGIDSDAFEIVDRLLSSGAKTKSVNIMTKENNVLFLSPDEYKNIKKETLLPAYKITLTGLTDSDGQLYSDEARRINSQKYSLARSFSSYIEIMKTDYTKGYSAEKLKKHLNAKLLVGVGDYENDIPLFHESDVSFAVGNAIDALKQIATYTVKENVDEAAIASVIAKLEKITR